MGMPSASVQPGTQPQGKGFAQSVNPPPDKQLMEMQAQASRPQMNMMNMPSQMTMDQASIYTVPQNQRPQQSQLTGKGAGTTNAATSGQPRMGQQGGSAEAYFDANPDVAQSFKQNNYGMDPQTFANTHFQKYGQGEGRTMPGQQPRLGQPNPYSNTVRQWDNASIQPQQRQMRGGKGKGA